MTDDAHGPESDIDVLIVFTALGGLALACIGTLAMLWHTGIDVYDTYGIYAGHGYVMLVGVVLFGIAVIAAKRTGVDDGSE